MELQGHVGGHLAGGMGWGCPGLSPASQQKPPAGMGGWRDPPTRCRQPLALWPWSPPISHGL